ncbi:DUF6318 family protein [Knoellia subterranea]|uniref:DUF6318 domain-containing protein n=1 Tax=Knoellia subterranea KCTC 19937 TaxID=1385521 RepID=A0A0A0JGR4_9MICO|nr:DUF6318 family protein [Knoellia subterranea]KGN36338.1 hypothetical protein N803_05910 [Knoellia subterranea KCTC 19937]
MLRALFAACRHRTTEGFRTMKSRTTMTYAVALALASTLALAGCNGGEKEPTKSATGTSPATGSASPSGSPSSSATTSPSASTAVSIPAAARAHTDEGAIAFVRFFFETVNAAHRAPDTTLLPPLSTNECKSCTSLQATALEYATKGHRAESAPTAPLSALRMRVALPADPVMVEFTLTQNKTSVVDKAGNIVDSQERKQRSQIAVLVWKEGQWFMNGLAAA